MRRKENHSVEYNFTNNMNRIARSATQPLNPLPIAMGMGKLSTQNLAL